jgi:hypothetical protein
MVALLEGGQLLAYDLTAVTGRQQPQHHSPPPAGKSAATAALTEQQRSRSPSPVKQQQQASAPAPAPVAPPPVVQLFRGQLQGQPLVTAARLRMIPTQPVPLRGLQGASMSGLRQWAASNKQAAAPGEADKQAWQWVVQGGQPAAPPTDSSSRHQPGISSSSSYATLYCTGHSDGAVHLWDMHGQAPSLLGCAPSGAASSALAAASTRRGKAAAVSTLEFAWEQGLIISGHEGGEVRQAGLAVVGRCARCATAGAAA